MQHAIFVTLILMLYTSIGVCAAEALTPTEVLIEEGHEYGADIVKSPLCPFLSSLADEHAREVCRGVTPHHGFHNRAIRAMRDQAGEISEIVSRSWAGQSISDGGHDAWKSWKASRAHWRTANGKPKAYDAALRLDRRGRWVAVIIASWR